MELDPYMVETLTTMVAELNVSEDDLIAPGNGGYVLTFDGQTDLLPTEV